MQETIFYSIARLQSSSFPRYVVMNPAGRFLKAVGQTAWTDDSCSATLYDSHGSAVEQIKKLVVEDGGVLPVEYVVPLRVVIPGDVDVTEDELAEYLSRNFTFRVGSSNTEPDPRLEGVVGRIDVDWREFRQVTDGLGGPFFVGMT